MVTKLFYVHVDVLFFLKKVPISVPSPCHSKRIGPGRGQTDTVLLQPRQWWRGQVTEGDLLTRVAARLLGYVLTAWPRSKKEGRLLGSNPAPIERAPTA